MKFNEIINEKLFTGVHDHGEYYEVYKNPTPSEIKDIVKTEKKKNDVKQEDSIYDTVRGGIDKDMNIYCFSSTLLHHDAQKKANIQFIITFEYETRTDILRNFSFFNFNDENIKHFKELNFADHILSTFPDIKKFTFRGQQDKKIADKLFS